MKELGTLDPRRLKEDDTFRTLFDPLTDEIFNALVGSIRNAGILTPLIVMNKNDACVVLSGHQRLKAAFQLGINEVPCRLAETYEEIEDALFDNVFRRQMTDAQRKKVMGRKKDLIDTIIRETVIPEIYELYKNGKIDQKLLNTLATLPIHTQEKCLASLATEVPAKGAALKEQERKLEAEYDEKLKKKEDELKAEYDEKLKKKEDEVIANIAKIATEKEGLENEFAEVKKKLADKVKEIAVIHELQKAFFDQKEKYNVEKAELEETIKKEMVLSGEEEEKIRLRQSQAIKDKDKKIGMLEEKLESIANQMKGIKKDSGLFEIEMGIVLEKYRMMIEQYENPELILGSLQSIHDSLARAFDVATALNLLPANVARVNRLVDKIVNLARKIAAVCQKNVKNIPILDEEIKAVKKSVKAAMETEQDKAPTSPLTLVREGTEDKGDASSSAAK